MKKDAIFKHPRVHDWGGGLDTVNVNVFPYKLSYYKEQILNEIINNVDDIVECLRIYLGEENSLVIYGVGIVGKILVKQLSEKNFRPVYILDKYKSCEQFCNIEVFDLKETEELSKKVGILITPLLKNEEIDKDLKTLGYDKRIHIKDFIKNKELKERISRSIS